jgi:SM-20-related protein
MRQRRRPAEPSAGRICVPNHESIADALAERGWCVTPHFIPADLARELQHEARAMLTSGALRPAGIGADARFAPEVRRDQIAWLEPHGASFTQARCLEAFEALRESLNESLQLGAFELECHFAVYPPGAFYRRHRDQQTGSLTRVVSCALYLNENWRADDGGQLRLYLGANGEDDFRDVLPESGTLACFMSERFWHEVLPATCERFSVSGWFRRRAGARA